MSSPSLSPEHQRARDLYLVGLGCVMLGAWMTDFFESMLPLAMGASAGLMLSMPLVRELGRRFLGRNRQP